MPDTKQPVWGRLFFDREEGPHYHLVIRRGYTAQCGEDVGACSNIIGAVGEPLSQEAFEHEWLKDFTPCPGCFPTEQKAA